MRNRLRMLTALVLIAVFVMPAARVAAQDDPVLPVETTQAGPLAIGQSIEMLRAELPPPFELGEELRVFPEIDGYAVTADGSIQAFVSTGEDDDEVRLIILVNERFRTAEGIGPGSTVADTEAAYGPASLEWFPEDRGNEVVEFGDQPEFLQFLTSDAGGPRAGVYDDGELATDVYEEDATLSTIWIDCRDRTCPEVETVPDPVEDDDDTSDADADDEDGDIEDMMEPDDMDEPVFPDADEDETGSTLANTGFSPDETLVAFGFTLVGLGCAAQLLRRRI